MLVSPILPDGTSVYTGAARYRLETRTTPRRAMLETFGQPSYAYALGHLGLGADEIARRLFAGTVSPVQILRRHTLFGFARHFLMTAPASAASRFPSLCRSIAFSLFSMASERHHWPAGGLGP